MIQSLVSPGFLEIHLVIWLLIVALVVLGSEVVVSLTHGAGVWVSGACHSDSGLGVGWSAGDAGVWVQG